MSASSAGGMARMRCLPQRSSDGRVVKACAVSTKRQLHRFGIVRLQRLCSTCAESRLQQTRWGEARTLCSCNSIMRNQQMSSPSARFPAVRLAREQCGSQEALPARQRPCQSLDSRPTYATTGLGGVRRRGLRRPLLSSERAGTQRGSKIHFFGQAKRRVIEVRGPQDSSGSALEYAEHAKRERAASHAVGCKVVQ